MKRCVVVAVLAALLPCVSACGGALPEGPPEIRFGIDACDSCGMTIAEPRYAGAALADDGGERRVLKFDDLGCLARFEVGPPEATVRHRWVHDRLTAAWIDATAATFAEIPELSTPMGSGLAAFRTRSDAEALVAERGGEELSWTAILSRARGGSLKAHPSSRREDAR